MARPKSRLAGVPTFVGVALRLPLRVARDSGGLAAVEFAFVLPVLALILAGLIDYSRLASQRMQVRAAAQSGADYVLRYGWDDAAVRLSIMGSTKLQVAPEPAPKLVRGCLSDTQIVETTAELCPSGIKSGTYVTASARANFKPLMPWPGIVVPDTIHGSAFARVQ
jgi:Flp pilus assembly protein TadG